MLLKRLADEAGFFYCGISTATQLDDEARRLETWLNKGFHGKMHYMANHFDKRIDPRKLVDGAKSVVTLLYNYFQPETQRPSDAPKVSMYANGDDYHTVIKDKLYLLVEKLRLEVGDFGGRVFVDSAPVLEKAWAQKSGAGWIGKNSNLITRKAGSYFFLSELILDLELEADGPIKDYCGKCTRCIDACPTQAIEAYTVNGSKCISYLTIELREAIPTSFSGKMDNWVFGCDVCQQVCPWNRFAQRNQEPKFSSDAEWHQWNKAEWYELTEEVFKRVFKNSPVNRTGYVGLMRSLRFIDESQS